MVTPMVTRELTVLPVMSFTLRAGRETGAPVRRVGDVFRLARRTRRVVRQAPGKFISTVPPSIAWPRCRRGGARRHVARTRRNTAAAGLSVDVAAKHHASSPER